ncbi:zinc-binding protein A33-like [Scleropages formosus]|nr:zinc-binding protein A33-like [Scleropages formosus]
MYKGAELLKAQRYAVDVTLDPDTAHPQLVLSEDRKRVRHENTKQELPDNPERFKRRIGVLGKERFSSGRHYWEVEVGDKTDWDLGVARESINRKGKPTLSPNNGYWTICLRNGNEYKANAESSVSLPLSVKPQKVGVYVDYEEGQVSFYSVEEMSHIYIFTGYKFTEKLYPFFWPGAPNSAPLIISPVSHTD